jgi:hypothetical protein
VGGGGACWFLAVARAFAGLAREPFPGLVTTETLPSAATAAGFDMIADDVPAAWLADRQPKREPVLGRICVLAVR